MEHRLAKNMKEPVLSYLSLLILLQFKTLVGGFKITLKSMWQICLGISGCLK